MKRAPLLLVDSASLYFRAFHGVPIDAATAPDGTPVNAVRGFLDMLATLIRGRGPRRVVCALDEDWRPAWRVALIPSYKTHRVADTGGPDTDAEAVPDLLSPQVPIILDVLAAVGITAVGAADYEADDVIGTLAAREPGPIEVASGDRDLFQVVDDTRGVRLLYCGRGVSKLEVFDEAAVLSRYAVPAHAYADFAALRGDPSDGLPGVGGVGEKTAARLITRHGDLTSIVAAIDDPTAGFAPGLRASLAAARDYLAVAPTVVRIARDVPTPALPAPAATLPADPDLLAELTKRWGLTSPVGRLVSALVDSTHH